MTIQTSVSKAQFSGNGAQTSFACGFYLPAASYVTVVTTDSSGNQTTIQPGPSTGQYQLSGVGGLTGFTVTYQQSGAPLPSGWRITIARVMPYTQLVSLTNQNAFYQAAVEGGLDNLVMLIQQFVELTSRTPLLPLGALSTFSQTLPTPVANQAIGYNSTATGFAAIASLTGLSLPVAVNQGGTGATSAAQALINLGASTGPWTVGPVPTYVNASTLTMAGDQTSVIKAGTRRKLTVTAGTVYGVTMSASFGAGVTTEVLNMVSGALDSGLSAGSYASLDAVNSSVPLFNTNAKGAGVTSAATTNIWVQGGDLVHITGTASITSLGTSSVIGAAVTTVTDAACTFVNGSNLVLPGGMDILAAAGDVQVWRYEGSSVVRCVGYSRASQLPSTPPGGVIGWAGSVAPAGWYLCDGSSQLRAGTFAGVFAAIGTQFGTADGTHFNLPDIRGRVIVGVDNMGGSTAGRITNAISGIVGTTLGASGGNEAMQAHAHTGGNTAPGASGSGANGQIAVANTGSFGAGASQNVQPSITLNYIIKL